MILAPTTRRVIRPFDKPSFVHTQRYGLVKGHWANEGRVGLWLFNDLGNTVVDLSGNGNTGTLVGTAHFAPCKFGTGVGIFDWQNYITVPSSPSLDGITSQVTVLQWVKIKDNTNPAASFEKSIGESVNTCFAHLYGVGYNFSFRVYDEGINKTTKSEFLPDNDRWYQIVGTYDGNSVKIYVDGLLSGTPVAYVGDIDNGVGGTRIGGQFHGAWILDGWLDHTIIWNRALSASEIAELTYNPFLGIERRTRISYFFIPAAVGGINYEDLLLGVSINASVSETDTQQMLDTEKDVLIVVSISEADNQQMLDTNKTVSFAASVSETDTQQMVDTSLGVTVVASLNVTDNQQMVDTNKAVTFAAGISVADTRQMFDIDLSVSFAASIAETDNQQMKDLLKDVSFAASISETDTQQMKDLLKAITFAASCSIETEVYYDASAVVIAMYAFIILRQHTS